MHRPAIFSGTGTGIPECIFVGPLYDYVQQLDEGADARSLHHLVGQLHMAAGEERAKTRWLAAVRERFAARGAACFDSAFAADANGDVLSDPRGDPGFGPAVAAMKSALVPARTGEAVMYLSTAPIDTAQGRVTVCGAAVKHTPSRALGFVFLRPHDSVADTEAVLEYVAAIVWHMNCADQALRRAAAQFSPLEVIELLPVPCLITDAAGRSIERNEAFAEFMQEAAMHLSTGRIAFHDPYLQDSWAVALNEVHLTAVRQSLLVTAPNGRQWQVHVVPFRFALGSPDAPEKALILVVAESQVAGELPLEAVMPEPSRPLTPAETEVLNALLQGHSAKVIANARGASVNTVRSQIMTILGKTGHHNQKSLIAAFAPSGFRNSIFSGSGFSIGSSRDPRSKR